jgi:hypothetical protein
MAALKTQIAATVDGTGTYVYDVSGTDQVVHGQAFQPHRLPGVYVFFISATSRQDGGRTVLTRYDRQLLAQVEGWVPTDSATPGEAMLDALDLGADIRRALESDLTLGSIAQVRNELIDITATAGDELDRPGVALCVLRVRVDYTEDIAA